MSAIITFDVDVFRAQIPEMSNASAYPDVMLQGYWDVATSYISNVNYGYLRDDSRVVALNYMTAHLAKLFTIICANTNQTAGQVQSATIDKISVTMTPPPMKDQFQWWLGITSYGQMLLALLQVKSVGGMYVGGLPERSAFRKVGGIH
jgi:hypothetical protein